MRACGPLSARAAAAAARLSGKQQNSHLATLPLPRCFPPAPLQAATESEGAAAAGGPALQSMQRAAAKRGREYERAADKAPAPGSAAYVDYSRRSFFKEFVKVVQSSDVLIEVLDARDPLGCRCLDVERFVRKIDPSKKIVLLLNKIGGCPCMHVCTACA